MTTKKKTAKKGAARKPAKPAKTGRARASAKAAPRTSATVAAVLGHAPPKSKAKKRSPQRPVRIKAEWQKYYQILLDLRDRLLQQMDGLAKESSQEMDGYGLHMADAGTDNFDRDFALSLLSSDQDAVYEIEEAIKRIEKSTYGICELTGKPIPKARLQAIPWTRFTVEAQAQLERDGALRQRRLGVLGTVDNKGVVEIEEEDDSSDEKSAKEKV